MVKLILSETTARGRWRAMLRARDPAFRKREMKQVFLGIPVLNRDDLLSRCLSALDLPLCGVLVNNNEDAAFAECIDALAARHELSALNQPRNLGVAASWNLILRTAFARGFDFACIGSNDTVLRPGSLAAAVRAAEAEPQVGVWHLHAFNFFLVRRDTVERVGWFDENFYPAYKEDEDYCYRCALAGVRRANVPGAGGEHAQSMTIRSDPELYRRNLITHEANRRFYLAKWGGEAGEEKFKSPFRHATRDHTWWPPPPSRRTARPLAAGAS